MEKVGMHADFGLALVYLPLMERTEHENAEESGTGVALLYYASWDGFAKLLKVENKMNFYCKKECFQGH